MLFVAFHTKSEMNKKDSNNRWKQVKSNSFMEIIFENVESAYAAVILFDSKNWRGPRSRVMVYPSEICT